MKESFYFTHDYDPTGDPKIQALLGEYGGMGYGIYWRIVEMLHTENTHELPLKPYIYLALAKQMLSKKDDTIDTAKYIEDFIKFCIEIAELFILNGDYFYSERVKRNFQKRDEIVAKRREAGRKGGEEKKKQILANAKQNVAKERKGKEIKENTGTTDTVATQPKNPEYENSINFLREISVHIFDPVIETPDYAISHETSWRAFLAHWIEKDSRGKMRAEKEKTFDLKLRFLKWLSNGYGNKTIKPQRTQESF